MLYNILKIMYVISSSLRR